MLRHRLHKFHHDPAKQKLNIRFYLISTGAWNKIGIEYTTLQDNTYFGLFIGEPSNAYANNQK